MSNQVEISPLSFCPTKIQVIGRTGVLSHATGFFYGKGTRTFLISNWHVFSGRHSNTGQPLHRGGDLPLRFSFDLFKSTTTRETVKISLQNPYPDEIGPFIQHRKGQVIDVAAIEVEGLDNARTVRVNEIPHRSDMLIQAGDDVFILGYPMGISKQELIPVWKRGSIASEPNVPIEGQNKILVDSATREGMSGAPVFSVRVGPYPSHSSGLVITPGQNTKFIGIYSGRYGAEDEMAAQLGIVWGASYIDEMLHSPATASYSIRK